MSDILPIDREQLEEEKPLEPIKEEEEEEVEEVKEEEPTQEELFDKKKEKKNIEIVVEEAPKPKKKKRQLSEKQLENLKKAREKSMARRRELKEARDIEKALKKEERNKKAQEKLAKQAENEELLLLKGKIKRQAEANAVWDEARIEALMNKTLDTYMEKRRKEKSIPKTTIPAPLAYPHLPPNQQPLNPNYYSLPQQTTNYYTPQPKKQYKSNNSSTLNNLFGFDGNEQI